MNTMKENVLDFYIGLDEQMTQRTITQKLAVTIFAGIKFLFDRLMAIFGLIIASPLMLIIAIAIKLDSKGSILFKQERTGKHGKNFYVYKFRTMAADNNVHDFSKADQHTKVGKILRKTSLDELPQLFSIAIGKMSFIGPRPWIPDYYENMNEEQRHRTDVRPGLTGLAQCMGRNNITIIDKINYDLEYIRNYSIIQDIKIIFLTIKCVFTGSGADAGKNTIKKEINELKKINIKFTNNKSKKY